MSTGVTTYYNLPFPYGDEPMSNVDDIIRRLAQDIDLLFHNASVGKVVAYRLAWVGSHDAVALEDFRPTYTESLDYTSGAGTVPEYSLANGIVIPSDGLWSVESASVLVNSNPVGTVVVLDSSVVINGSAEISDYSFPTGPSSTHIQIDRVWTGWLTAGSVVRSRSMSNITNVVVEQQTVRLTGPLSPVFTR